MATVLVSNGYSLDIVGAWNGENMTLEGEVFYHNQLQPAQIRGIWMPNEDGTVRQFFEQFDPKSKTWKPWFDGLYQKVE